jgi:hypothetical protein
MDTSIATCVITGAACYIAGGLAMPAEAREPAEIESVAAGRAQ